MGTQFEPVIEVFEYYDGPRSGTALFRNVPHHFKSRMLDVHEYKGDFESADIFELTAVSGPHGSPVLLACGTFRVAAGQSDLPAGSLRQLEVSWRVVGDDSILL
jgi:hypothetical protein